MLAVYIIVQEGCGKGPPGSTPYTTVRIKINLSLIYLQLHDEADRRMAKKKRTHGDSSTSSGNHRSQQVKENNGNNLKMASGRGNGASGGGNEPEVPEKVVRIANNMNDPNSSDHVVAMTQLKETIASLQKKLNMKDKELLEKDKLVILLFSL